MRCPGGRTATRADTPTGVAKRGDSLLRDAWDRVSDRRDSSRLLSRSSYAAISLVVAVDSASDRPCGFLNLEARGGDSRRRTHGPLAHSRGISSTYALLSQCAAAYPGFLDYLHDLCSGRASVARCIFPRRPSR